RAVLRAACAGGTCSPGGPAEDDAGGGTDAGRPEDAACEPLQPAAISAVAASHATALQRVGTSVVGVEDAAHRSQPLLQICWVPLLHDLALLAAGVHDLPALERNGDVVAIAEQVARLRGAQRHLVAGLLLLVRVARQEHAEAPVD